MVSRAELQLRAKVTADSPRDTIVNFEFELVNTPPSQIQSSETLDDDRAPASANVDVPVYWPMKPPTLVEEAIGAMEVTVKLSV